MGNGSPFRSPEFARLQKAWNQKLKKSGFVDCEDQKGRLKKPNNRTIGFKNRDRIRDFFIALDHYLTDHPDLPRYDRKILSLYSDGTHLNDIARAVHVHVNSIKKVICKYKIIIIEIMESEPD